MPMVPGKGELGVRGGGCKAGVHQMPYPGCHGGLHEAFVFGSPGGRFTGRDHQHHSTAGQGRGQPRSFGLGRLRDLGIGQSRCPGWIANQQSQPGRPGKQPGNLTTQCSGGSRDGYHFDPLASQSLTI